MKWKEIRKEFDLGLPYFLLGAVFVLTITTEWDKAKTNALIEERTAVCEKLTVLLEQAQEKEKKKEVKND